MSNGPVKSRREATVGRPAAAHVQAAVRTAQAKLAGAPGAAHVQAAVRAGQVSAAASQPSWQAKGMVQPKPQTSHRAAHVQAAVQVAQAKRMPAVPDSHTSVTSSTAQARRAAGALVQALVRAAPAKPGGPAPGRAAHVQAMVGQAHQSKVAIVQRARATNLPGLFVTGAEAAVWGNPAWRGAPGFHAIWQPPVPPVAAAAAAAAGAVAAGAVGAGAVGAGAAAAPTAATASGAASGTAAAVATVPAIDEKAAALDAAARGIAWQRIRKLVAGGKPGAASSHTSHTLPAAIKEELEALAAELGLAPPGGDYAVTTSVAGERLEHAEEISRAYGGIQEIVINLFLAGDDVAINAMSQSGFLKRLVKIEPTLCNQQTSKELLDALARIPKRGSAAKDASL